MNTATLPSTGGAPAPAAGTATGLLIIGASQSGVQLAISLRALGYTGHITLLGDEDHRPYQRPALSKEFLQDKVGSESLIFRSNDYWIEHNITLVKGERIEDIASNPDGSGVATGRSGARYPYTRLALTVGARPRVFEVPGSELDGVVYLRNADDALKLKELAPAATDVVVIGGGFIGLEAASSLQAMDKKVTVIEYGPRLVGRAVGEDTSAYFLEQHRARGLDIHLNARVSRIVGDGAVSSVHLESGDIIPAQIVLVGIGVIPNTQLGEQLGLEVDNGIVVDEAAIASDGHTLVVGDVANMPNPVPGAPDGERIRLESVNNAVEHAKVAAYALMGQREAYAGIPWFWSNQADMKLQIAGLSMGFDSTVKREVPEKGKFTVLYYRGGQVIAADCVNAPLDFMAVKQALAAGKNIDPAAAADTDTMLKTLIS
ncbi:NAD(P)/FAD-dependent oxidoreductase [Glutamicibacter soli]|uniref:NAD(P)/FAD-dependent oxidoreductase n=1 Tax=Glutamicibacter soli TaxID=453836 RepID=UPI003FD43AE1